MGAVCQTASWATRSTWSHGSCTLPSRWCSHNSPVAPRPRAARSSVARVATSTRTCAPPSPSIATTSLPPSAPRTCVECPTRCVPLRSAKIAASELERVCLALAIFADLKGTHLVGHSTHVAEIAGGAARLMGMDDQAVANVHAAGLLHDLGRTAVSSGIWERKGPLGPADRERVRLHTYWTERILSRCPVVADVARDAAARHERLDGSGYHR